MNVIRIGIAVTFLGLSACEAVASELDPRVTDIAERSRHTNATYSLYTWNKITLEGSAPRGDWAAEFHSGTKHRVESSGHRLVADCVSMKGTALDLATMKLDESDWVAKAACGINANNAIVSSQYIGPISSRLGSAKRVRMTDAESIRTYDVAESGALIAATISDLDGTMRVDNFAVDYKTAIPKIDIFSTESLRTTVVPDSYKRAPISHR